MNRVLKFRAWDDDKKLFFNPLHHNCYDFEEIQTRGLYDISQFTGLTDIECNEIYEGDIMASDKNVLFRVYWDVERGCFSVVCRNIWNKINNPSLFKSLIWASSKCRVIGSVYSNPELLK